jgi:hypothetical protein
VIYCHGSSRSFVLPKMGVGLASMTLGTPVVAPTVTVLVSVVSIVVVGVTVVTGLRVDVGLIVSLKVGVRVVRGVSNTIGVVVVLSAICAHTSALFHRCELSILPRTFV